MCMSAHTLPELMNPLSSIIGVLLRVSSSPQLVPRTSSGRARVNLVVAGLGPLTGFFSRFRAVFRRALPEQLEHAGENDSLRRFWGGVLHAVDM